MFPLHSVFLALPLEGDAKNDFQRIQKLLVPYESCFTFQKPETPHLTLQFWREMMEIEYFDVLARCKKIADATPPFSLTVTSADTFGKNRREAVLFLSVHFSPELASVKKRCPWPSEKSFHPHITLARIKHPERFSIAKKKIEKVLKNISFEIPVEQLRLYANIAGVHQTPLQSFEFLR